MDTLFAAAILDSAKAARAIVPLLSKFSFLDPQLALALAGALAAAAVDALEAILRWGRGIPMVATILGWWKAHSRVISPVLAMLAGAGLTGDWLVGIIGAGLRSMLFGGKIFTTTPQGVKAIGTAVAVAVMLGLGVGASSAAVLPDRLVSNFQRVRLSAGIGTRWQNASRLDFSSARPLPWMGGKISYAVSDHIAPQVNLTREFGHSGRWTAEAGVWLVW